MKNNFLIITILMFLIFGCKNNRQIDENYKPNVKNPAYEPAQGSLILIDEAHNNFHTKDGLYSPLTDLLTLDGYRVEGLKSMTEENLEKAKIFIISNAMPENYRKNTNAFTDADVEMITNWIKTGGSLFFIADHMPCPEAAIKLSEALDIKFINCYALDTTKNDFEYFNKADSTLANCVITQGRDSSEIVDAVVSFTGQAFEAPETATAILKFPEGYLMAFPERPWQFNENTRYEPITNQVQGAIFEYGEGRVAVFGEAAMFSAQVNKNKVPVGFGFSKAKQNEQFTLNVIHWLDRIIE